MTAAAQPTSPTSAPLPPLPLRPAFTPDRSMPIDAVVVAESNDQVARHLFDVGLRMSKFRMDMERDDDISDVVRTRISGLLDDLDAIIRDAGLRMLALAGDDVSATLNINWEGRSRRGRRD
ncbi:hypothetical protein GZH49_36415 [Nocardia terpenica]|uniref:hypothetical protein n=1 Tax=Nocardia terpenica TaxID=455432 RepID=UPI002FE1DB78